MDNKENQKQHDWGFIAFMVFLAVLLMVTLGAMIKMSVDRQAAFAAMSDDEKAAYIESRTHSYEVVYAYPDTITDTNRFGGVIRQTPCWRFGYIDDKGNLKEVGNFVHHEYGLTKVKLAEEGESSRYEEASPGLDTYRTLYLTREMMTQ